MGGGYQPKRVGADRVAQAIKDLQRSVADINRRISGLGIQVDKADAEVIIAAGRSLVVNGNTLIEGSLSVPNGSITNAALNAPVYPVAVGSSATNFSIPPTTNHAVCNISVPVPAGYTRALVHMNTDLTAWNSTTSTTFFAVANSYPGALQEGLDNLASVPPNTAVAVSDSAQALLTGLTSGDNIQLSGEAYTQGGTIPASTSNGMNVAAIVLFLR